MLRRLIVARSRDALRRKGRADGTAVDHGATRASVRRDGRPSHGSASLNAWPG